MSLNQSYYDGYIGDCSSILTIKDTQVLQQLTDRESHHSSEGVGLVYKCHRIDSDIYFIYIMIMFLPLVYTCQSVSTPVINSDIWL